MIRGIIFDCFGVLYAEASHVYFSQFPEHHDELYDLNKMADHGFIDKKDYVKSVADITGVSEEETLKAFANEYTLNAPLVEYIQRELKPRFKIGLLSNIGREWIQDFFDTHRLHNLFDAVTLSSEEGIAKPNPLIFEHAAEKLGLEPSECLMIDDRQENCEGAKAAGMEAVIFTSNKQLLQYLKDIKKA